MNSGGNVLGQGNRANATIGRAVQARRAQRRRRQARGCRPLGARQPSQDRSRVRRGRGRLAVDLARRKPGFDADQSTVTVWCGGGPQVFVDQLSRTPESLTKHFANYLKTNLAPKMAMMETLLVIGPEHMSRYRDAGWDRPGSSPNWTPISSWNRRPDPRRRRHRRRPARSVLRQHDRQVLAGGIHVVHAGGATGLFSMAFMAGFRRRKVVSARRRRSRDDHRPRPDQRVPPGAARLVRGPNRSTVSPSDSSTSPNRAATSSSTELRRSSPISVRRSRFMKPTFAKPAPVDLRHEIATSCDAVIEALAD